MIRRSYVDTRAGQMHVAEAGDGAPLVLLHWFPLSGRMYEAELPVFAELGWRAIALDTMGLGQSAPREAGWSVEQHADCFADALAGLGADNPVVLGGHMAAVFAAELASRDALSIRAAIFDGGPFVDPGALKGLMEKMGRVAPAMAPTADGAHRSFLWNMAENTYDIFAPEGKGEPALMYRFIADYISAYLLSDGTVATDLPHDYPMADKLAALMIPGVVLSAQTEPLRTALEPMLDHYGGPAQQHIFSGDHPLHALARAGEFARAIDAALRVLGVAP